MKKLIFSNILIASLKSKKAIKVEFDPQRTVIHGKNQTGKSALIKSLYSALGAKPPKIHPDWKNESVTICLRFKIGNQKFTIVKDGNEFGIFDVKDKLIKIFSSVTNELGPFLSELFDFKIKLPNQQNEIITPPPAFLFLPFYVDQDVSWNTPWKSFDNLHQIKRYRIPMIEYHTGLKPNEYYEIKGKLQQLTQDYNELDNEKNLAISILKRVKLKLTDYSFDVNIEEFKNEIEDLLIEYQKIKDEEETLKRNLSDLFNIKIVIESQINIAKSSLGEIKKDYEFATGKLDDLLYCPTCGAEYENNFVERFEIAKDEQRLMELTSELMLELKENENMINKEKSKLVSKKIDIEKIESLLNSKKEEVKLKDLIDNQGKNEVKAIIESSTKEIEEQIKNILIQQKNLEAQIKELENKERRKEIINTYSFYMKRYTNELDVKISEKDYSGITKNIVNVGSALPRTLIAYYFSLLEVIKSYSSTAFCPIVIDSPNQQAQDIEHLDKILNFIKNHQPEDSQMILALEEFYDINFNCPIVEVDQKYSLLKEDLFNDVYEELKIYWTQMYEINRTGKIIFL